MDLKPFQWESAVAKLSPEQVADVYERFVPKVFTFCML